MQLPRGRTISENFTEVKDFSESVFSDVTESDWFYDNVKSAYRYGLMVGMSENTFGPSRGVTIAETITIAARIHSLYHTGRDSFAQGNPWYQVYVDYAMDNAIIGEAYGDYNKSATRAEFADILYKSLPQEALQSINAVADDAIPDVKTGDAYAEAVYALYRAGILTGNDDQGTFAPVSGIQRSEVAAIVSRMVDGSLRKTVTLGETFVVTFHNDSEVHRQTVAKGQSVTEPEDPTRRGYRFKGWYSARNGGDRFDFDTPIFEDVDLYARWSKKSSSGGQDSGAAYTVAFEANGENVENLPEAQTVKEGEYANMPVSPTREGYSFAGWSLDASATGTTSIFNFASTPITEDVVLYAMWLSLDISDVTPVLMGRLSGTTAILTWANTPNAVWYDLYCSTSSGGPYYVLAEGLTGTRYEDTIAAGDQYYYVIVACNSMSESKQSNEVALGSNQQSSVVFVPTLDIDGDDLSNEEELLYATDYMQPDTDGDGLSDGDEVRRGTDPRNPDTDGDGIYDGVEIQQGLDPLKKDQMSDVSITIETPEGDATAVVSGNNNLAMAPARARQDDNYLLTSIKGIVGAPINFSTGGYPISSAVLTFRYTDEELAEKGYQEDDLRLFYVNPDTMKLEELETTVDSENNTATATTDHFSTYLLADKNIEVDLSNVDIIFVIDESGSMSSNDRERYRVQAAKYFVEKMNEVHNRAAVVGFSSRSSARMLSGLTTDKAVLNSALDRITDSGGTYIIPGLELAINEFESKSTGNQRRVVILLTDGQSSDSPENVALAAYANYNVVINTVALGRSAATASLQQIASNSKGSYFYINDTGSLSYDDVKKQIMLIYEKLSKQLTLTEYAEQNSVPSAPFSLEFSDLYTGIESNEVQDWITTAATNLLTGNYINQVTDIGIDGSGFDLAFTRTYNSFASDSKSVIGTGFTTNFDTKVEKVAKAEGSEAKIGTVTAHTLNVRAGAGTSNRIIGTLSKGARVEIKGSTDLNGKNWYKIEYNGNDAYIAGWYVDGYGGYRLTLPTGTVVFFTQLENGTIKANNSVDGTFEVTGSGYRYTDASFNTYTYGSNGRIERFGDKYGNEVAVSYSGDKLASATDAFGRKLTFTVNGSGLISSISDSDGRSVSYTYDSEMHLTSVVDVNGNATKYDYHSGSGKLIKITDANGNQLYRIDYDILGRIVRQYDAREIIRYYIYDDVVNGHENGVSARYIIDENGKESKYTFNANLKPLAIRDTKGNETKYQYSYYNGAEWIDITDPDVKSSVYETYSEYVDNNRVAYKDTVIDQNGNKTTTEYDTRGNAVKVTDALGNSEVFAYDSKNNLTSKTDKNGATTTYTYDAQQMNCIEQVNPLGLRTSYTYYAAGSDGVRVNGLVRSETAPNGGTTNYVYGNSYNDLTVERDAYGKEQTYKYDGLSRVVQATDPNGNETKYEYDAAGNVVKTTGADGAEYTVVYDAMGHKLSETDPLGRETKYTYDAQYNLLSVTDPAGNKTSYTYDFVGNKVSETNALGDTTRYYYDEAYRLIEVEDAVGNLTKYEYDAVGNKIKTTDALGRVTTVAYDALNRTVKETSAKNAVTQYTYDKNGNVTAVKNALGYTAKTQYDALGRQVAYTDENGYTKRTTYDDVNSTVTVTNANGSTTITAYDLLGRQIKITDALGNVQIFEYDAAGNVVTQTDANGNSVKYVYDSMNRVIEETVCGSSNGVAADKKNTYTYDLCGNILTYTDTQGSTTTYTYDELNRNTSVEDALGGKKICTYDALGNRLTETNEAGHTTKADYDELSRLVEETDALGNSTKYVYDAVGNRTKVIDANGNAETYGYDEHNNLIAVTDAYGNAERYAYDLMNRNIEQTDRNGNKTKYTYDKCGNLLTTTNAYATVETNAYDRVGNRVRTTDALGNATVYAYDKLNRLVSETDACGNTEYYTYDAVGNKTKVQDRNGNVTVNEYDDFNRLVAVTDASGNTTRYTYDAADNVTRITNALNQIEAYAYDELDQLIEKKDFVGNKTTMTYDAVGNMLTSTDRNGVQTVYTYDANGQTLSMTAGSVQIAYTYDAVGNILTTTDEIGTTVYTYDRLDRVTTVTAPSNKVTEYTYDAHGNSLSTKSPSGEVTTYTYDAANRMKTVSNDGDVSTYEYDANGNRAKLTLASGAYTTYTYDARNIMVEMVNVTDESNSETYSYVYDAAGLQISKTEPEGTTTFEYNALNQIAKVLEPDGKVTEYTYDAAGNRLEQSISGSETGSVQYAYDAAGRLVKTQETSGEGNVTTLYTYDDNGNQIEVVENKNGAAKTYEYIYNELNQLTEYSDGTQDVSYSYWASGLRAGKTVGTESTTYYYDGKTLLYEDGANTVDYVIGINLIAQKTDVTGYYMYNGHADVVQIHKYEGGIVVLNTYDYDIFGNVTKSEEQMDNAVRYGGYFYDVETGYYYLRTRYYDPQIARFISEDTFSGFYDDPLSLNKYTYCHNSPILYLDQNGNFVLTAFLITVAAGAVISAGVDYGCQRLIEKKSHSEVNWKSVGWSALEGAVSGAVGYLTGGASLAGTAVKQGTKTAVKQVATAVAADAVTTFALDIGRQMVVEDVALKDVDLGRSAKSAAFSAVITGTTETFSMMKANKVVNSNIDQVKNYETVTGRKLINRGEFGEVTEKTVNGVTRTYDGYGQLMLDDDAVMTFKSNGFTSRTKDLDGATKALGLEKYGSGTSVRYNGKQYTWHHLADGKTLQLVPTDIHDMFRHTGGDALFHRAGVKLNYAEYLEPVMVGTTAVRGSMPWHMMTSEQ